MNQGWVYREQITVGGQTILDYYTQRYRHSSRQEWRERIIAGQVLVNQVPAAIDTVLEAGQRLSYHRLPWQEPEVPLSFEVLYEDEDVVAIAKPSGLPVLPGGGFLEHTLLHLLRQRYPDNPPIPIHRLGRGTSGLMLLARSPQARSDLSRQMRDHTLKKVYRALVGPGDLPSQFTIEQAIGKIPHPTLGYIYGAIATGKFAHSAVQIIAQTTHSTLLEVTISTGRPHQIRIHLATVGIPLLGDPLYGAGGVPLMDVTTAVPGDCGYHLHAFRLGFRHPRTRQTMQVHCSPPKLLCAPYPQQKAMQSQTA